MQRIDLAVKLALQRVPAFDGAKLKGSYDKKEEIPEKYRDLFTERDGKWVADIEGLGDSGSVTRLEEALRKEKNDHKAAKEKLRKWEVLGADPEKVHEQLDEIPTLKELAKGKVDEEKLERLVETRAAAATAKLSRELEALKTKATELETTNANLTGTITRGKIENALRTAATKANLQNTAVDDAVLWGNQIFEVAADGAVVTKEGNGVKGGQTAEAWLNAQKETRSHWWPPSQGGGARGGQGGGGGANNPWSRDAWNLTEQGRVIREQGREKADTMAAAAGSKVGATAPVPASK